MLPKGWELKPFDEVINPVSYSNKVPKKDLLASGAYPVVSQELGLVNGFWDEEKDLFKVERSLIVFGDHTNIIKYIDFDFVLGADGVKIISPKDVLDVKFFYYYLHSVELKSLGYARHYRLLKELQIPIPPLPEQQRIVEILDEAFAGIDYATRLQCRMAYSSNGHQIYQIDMLTGEQSYVDDFLSPEALWTLTFSDADKDSLAYWRRAFAAIPFETKSGTWKPRYYQENAVYAVLDSLAKGNKRILLTLATGTGKTAIAFHLAWKLFHARWTLNANNNDSATRRPRILFLADRNILADQAFSSFGAFGDGALMRPCNNTIEFKQIVGRGTRLYEGKAFFSIYDFDKAYHNFADPQWDGEPLPPEEPKPTLEPTEQPEPTPQPSPKPTGEPTQPPEPSKEKIIIQFSDGKARQIMQHLASTLYWFREKPVTAHVFVQSLYDDLPDFFHNEDELREIWSNPSTRDALLNKLNDAEYNNEKFAEISQLIGAPNYDVYDILAYIAFERETQSRLERVDAALPRIQLAFSSDKQQDFINFVLNQYVHEGVSQLSQSNMKGLLALKYHGVNGALQHFSDIGEIKQTFVGFQRYLYQSALVL